MNPVVLLSPLINLLVNGIVIFATNSMTVAAIDRLVHHSTILEINAESYRKKYALTQSNNSN